MPAPRLAIAGFVHETVTFLPEDTPLARFEAAAARGDDLIGRFRGSNTVFGGFIASCERHGSTMLPLVAVDLPPSGPVADAAFEHFADEIIAGLRAGPAPDALLLHLHGAMVTHLRQDPDTELLRRIRECLGAARPIALALDLHANLAPEIVRLADIICGFRQSPHTDMAETGRRAGELLHRQLAGEIAPVMAMRKPGLVLPSVFTATGVPPLRELMAEVAAAETAPGMLDVSLFTGFAYADVACIGAAVIAVADGNEMAAARAAETLSSRLHDTRHALYRRDALLDPDDAVARAGQLVADGRRPVVLVEHADRGNDSTRVLAPLLASALSRVIVPYFTDPVGVAVAMASGVGAQVMLGLGGRSSDKAGVPVQFGGRVRACGPMRYQATGPYRTGEWVDLGDSAVIDNGRVTVIVTSNPVVAVDLDPFVQFGLEPDDYDVVLLRSKTHFRAAWEPIAAEILLVETPDWGPADLGKLDYHRVPAGVFPITGD